MHRRAHSSCRCHESRKPNAAKGSRPTNTSTHKHTYTLRCVHTGSMHSESVLASEPTAGQSSACQAPVHRSPPLTVHSLREEYGLKVNARHCPGACPTATRAICDRDHNVPAIVQKPSKRNTKTTPPRNNCAPTTTPPYVLRISAHR